MPVNTSDLIGTFTEHIKIDFAGKETIYYYIDNSYGNIYSDAFYYGYEYSYPHPSGTEKFIENVFESIDGYITLDFQRTYSKAQGNIDIYYLGTFYEGAAGLAYSATPYDSNVEIFWEQQRKHSYINGNYGSLKDRDAYTLIHEIGHALGLEHPNNDPYGSWHNSNDTVMSYNFIYNENLFYTQAPSWRPADIAALQNIWGIEDTVAPLITGPSGGPGASSSSKTIKENTKSVYTFSANETVTWSLDGGLDPSFFSINSSTGFLTFKNAPDFENNLDSNANGVYSINIRATDTAGNSSSQFVMVSIENVIEDVKNSAPKNLYLETNNYSYWDTTNTHIRIQEGLRGKTIIGLLSTDDDDKNDTHTFHFIKDNNQYPDANYFMIEGNKLKINSSPDYEIKNSYSLLVYAKDSAGNKTDSDFLFNIEVDNLIEKTYNKKFNSYKFYKQVNSQYQIKDDSISDTITGQTVLNFQDQAINVDQDIIGTFDQVTGLNTDSGEMFRLYNAAFARFPDADGLKYWIDEFSSGRNTRRVVAQSFLGSAEFAERYGTDVTNEKYVETLYTNVLGRNSDTEGYNYWVGNLNSGLETRYELLLGFAEAVENKTLFTEMTGFG
ncbi:DUF4214 domain-containing protein [Prochlorococcus sp. MIT 1011]|uniref:DUF4214 domain-containing protein n=1 Tax=Prochlorococcus sp. MIT 1011 TaxID=3082520 RepID=UPI0039B62BCA